MCMFRYNVQHHNIFISSWILWIGYNITTHFFHWNVEVNDQTINDIKRETRKSDGKGRESGHEKKNVILKMWYESEIQKCKKTTKVERKKKTLNQLVDRRKEKKMKWKCTSGKNTIDTQVIYLEISTRQSALNSDV